MRVGLIISTMGAGGAERVMSHLANALSTSGHSVRLITLSKQEDDFYKIHASVVRISFGFLKHSSNPLMAIINNLRQVSGLRAAIRESQADAVISFEDTTNVLTLLAASGLKVRVFVSERNHPTSLPLGRVRSTLRRRLYPRAAGVVVQTADVKRWASSFVPAEKIFVIPNPVGRVPFGVESRGKSKIVLSVGRLAAQKGHDMLIRAFGECRQYHSTWRLRIIGEGPSRIELEKLVSRCGLNSLVTLPGRTTSVFEEYMGAEIFALPSRFEGFPNALCEAMSAGLAAVSFDCPAGPRDIIRHRIDGLIVPANDVGAMSRALAELMENNELRRSFGIRAKEVVERFSVEKIVGKWEALLSEK